MNSNHFRRHLSFLLTLAASSSHITWWSSAGMKARIKKNHNNNNITITLSRSSVIFTSYISKLNGKLIVNIFYSPLSIHCSSSSPSQQARHHHHHLAFYRYSSSGIPFFFFVNDSKNVRAKWRHQTKRKLIGSDIHLETRTIDSSCEGNEGKER